MLFDLRGKRRRTVQVTYVGLAVLMAVGLVGAGIGSDASGGLFDIFGSRDGGGSVDKTVEKRIDRAEKRLRVNPKDPVALVTLVRSHYSLASADTDQKTGQFGKDGKKELAKASAAWKRYVASDPKKPDVSLAGLMVVAYSNIGLNQPSEATAAAELVAEERDDSQSYLQLMQYATLAGQTRKAELAGQKAIERAPKGQRKVVEDAVKQAQQAGARQAAPAPGG